MAKKKNKDKNIEKEVIRGAIKQMMKVNKLRSISIANYNKWLNNDEYQEKGWLHSAKIDLQDGYLNLYTFKPNREDPRAGEKLNNLSYEHYLEAYNCITNIFKDEANIPSNVKRNILVKMFR